MSTEGHYGAGEERYVSFRITTLVNGEETTIRVEGRLEGNGLSELQHLIRLANGTVALDLSGLLSVDAVGAQELRELSKRGVELRSPSAYIRQLLLGAS